VRRRAIRRRVLPGADAWRQACVAGLAVLAAAAAAAPANDGAWHLQLHSAQHSDATRLSQSGDLQGSDVSPRPGRNLAYLDDELRLTREQGAWTWGLIVRSRATLVASEDTLRLYRQADGGQPLTADQQWQLDARLRGFSGRGLVLGGRVGQRPAPAAEAHGATGWQLDWELQALQLGRWRERSITGTASADAESETYAFTLRSYKQSDRLEFPFQADHPRRGAALLGRVGLSWAGERWRVEARVQDLGWLHWRQLPRQEALLDSRTAGVDADGYVVYRPLVQGQNTQSDLRRAAPAWASASVGWRPGWAGKVAAEAGADVLPGFGATPWLGVSLPVGTAAAALRWHAHEQRLSLQCEWRGLTLRAGTDRPGRKAQSREFALGWRLAI